MTPFSPDVDSLCETLEHAIAEIADAFEAGGAPAPGDSAHPDTLAAAVTQYTEVLRRAQADRRPGSAGTARGPDADTGELCDYGLSLAMQLLRWAQHLGLDALYARIRKLPFPLALCMARNGAELRTLEPVVDAIAAEANEARDPRALEQLCAAMGEIMDAVAPSIQQDLDNSNPGRPWRVLNLNRGIVATRSHNPVVMDAVFRLLVRNLPEDAPEFFREGMAQMDALDYPDAVRKVMERYYNQWSAMRTLH